MNIRTFDKLIQTFIKESRYMPYYSSMEGILLSDKPYSLQKQPGYNEVDFLAENIKNSVLSYIRNKDVAIHIYKDFVDFLHRNNIAVDVKFPPVSIASSFERQMFIAKYLQDEDARVSDLSELLWVNQRTIEDDLKKLRGEDDDPIQVCGRPFYIANTERSNNRVRFESTAHPIFLAENLTQVVIMLKGLRKMSKQRIVRDYATATAANIWAQLSDYAKRRIFYVLDEVMPEDREWYEELENYDLEANRFSSERSFDGLSAIMFCMKNEKPFWLEYMTEQGPVIMPECRFVNGSYHHDHLNVICRGEEITVYFDRVIKSCKCAEELF